MRDRASKRGFGGSHAPASTLFTLMFLHGGWMHLGGNMLYLWIFGDNLEKVMDAVRFVIFYLLCGLPASLAHIILRPRARTFLRSARRVRVLGGYLLLFPQNRVRVLTRGGITHVPAHARPRPLDRHTVHQRSRLDRDHAETEAWPYKAHIGGFVAGLVLHGDASRRRSALA